MSTNYNKSITDNEKRIGEVLFSFLHVFEKAESSFGGEPSYSAMLIWPKTDKATTAMVQAGIDAAKEKGKEKWGGKVPANVRTPLRDGDTDRPDDPNCAGCYFMNAKSANNKPGVRVLENGKVVEAFPEDVYSGCFGAATVSFFPYSTAGNKGVGVGLGNIIKTRDGARLSGGVSADNAFADLGSEDDDILR